VVGKPVRRRLVGIDPAVALRLNRFWLKFGGLPHIRCNRQASAQVKPYTVRHLPDRDGQVHNALFLDLLEQSQAPCYLTNATFCLVPLALNVRKSLKIRPPGSCCSPTQPGPPHRDLTWAASTNLSVRGNHLRPGSDRIYTLAGKTFCPQNRLQASWQRNSWSSSPPAPLTYRQ